MEIRRVGQPVLQVDVVTAALVCVGEGDVAVVVGGIGEKELAARRGIVDGARCNRRWVHRKAKEDVVGWQGGSDRRGGGHASHQG